MQRFKRILTYVLLVFVATAVVTTFRPRETVFVPDGFGVLFWHSEKRCSSCLKMETLLRESLKEFNDLRLTTLEYDVFANHSLARQFNVGRTTIILVERQDQQNVRIRDLTDEVWNTINDADDFTAMLQKELKMFFGTED